MGLQLDPIIPMHRKCQDGRLRFNRGYHNPQKGKTLVELYGEERARDIIRRRSEKQKGHPGYCPLAHSKPCVAIKGGKIVARFPSITKAASALHLSYQHLARTVKKNAVSKNGGKATRL